MCMRNSGVRVSVRMLQVMCCISGQARVNSVYQCASIECVIYGDKDSRLLQ